MWCKNFGYAQQLVIHSRPANNVAFGAKSQLVETMEAPKSDMLGTRWVSLHYMGRTPTYSFASFSS